MAAIKPAASIAEKWARVTPQRATDYQAGIQQPRTSWAQASAGAQERYKSGVADAANRGAYQKGIAAAGDERWRAKALAKGPGRFAEGVSISGPDYQSGVQPYLDTIQATTLPQRFPKGDPRNLDRVKAIAMALRKRKTG